MDEDGLLRLGGRLSLSPLASTAKFPYIIGNHHITGLIVRHVHQRTLHGSIALILSALRDRYWVIQGRKIVKFIAYNCVNCARLRVEVPQQLMGSLPCARIMSPGNPFRECGVDYAGTFQIRMAGGRGVKARSGYIAVFVCFATKAIHLEVVTDYSSQTFLAAFDRFCSRRGLPATMYSDCGKTFEGADTELRRGYQEAIASPEFHAILARDQIRWSFIPPAAPHFGGLWEAGVKSVKRHLKRILLDRTPTLEELMTLLCRIEACLNSRPLGALSDDVECLDTLTPGHLLIGRAILSVPVPSILDVPENRLSRWQLVQQMLESFWKRWSDDYVRSCQHRTKWQDRVSSLRVGQIVLLQQKDLPPTKWSLGRITRCHPGKDGLTRVVTVRTAKSEYVRPISKLALLPLSLESGDTVS